jgi:FkbM family methyltransferase
MTDIAIDRSSGRLLDAGLADRSLIVALNAYGSLSRPFMQRGLYKACRLVGDAAWRGRTARIMLAPGADIRFPARDPYWNRMLLRFYEHEPEMARLLRRLAGVDYGFIDCGANIGYWAVYVASPACGGGKPVLAIEASAQTFEMLLANAAAHSTRIKPFHRAILDRSDIAVRLNTAAHEARGIAAEGEASHAETVVSIAIDDLIAQEGWSQRRLVVKLDVEGVEREALAGMEPALASDALVIYEDHGSDAAHALTRHILEERGLRVHLLLDDGLTPITDAGQLDAWKKDRTKGYNLIARKNAASWPEIDA